MKYVAFDNFILRTPLFNFQQYLHKSAIDSEEFKEGLMLASRDFYETVRHSPDSTQTQKTIYKYYSRACTRCTPFGLFASCSIGNITSDTNLKISSSNLYRKGHCCNGAISISSSSLRCD